MKLRVFFAAMAITLTGAVSVRGAWDTDPEEIRETAISKRLIALGFTEDATSSELYRNTNMTLSAFLREFNLRDSDLLPIPSGPPGEWMRRAAVDGNHTVLIHRFEPSSHRQMASNAILQIAVNLGYVRPTSIFLGMTINRAEAALGFINAKQVAPARQTNGEALVRYILPNKSGVEFELNNPNVGGGKPQLLTIKGMTLGEVGKGFADWEHQNTSAATNVPIAQFRKRGQ